ncbi:MAG TPA: ATP-binding protein [Burkholderiales bacterium]|jgi:serine/threonine-protein kinase RsbW
MAHPPARLSITNRIPELRRMSEWLHIAAATTGLPRDLTQRFDLCANEAVANIIGYGYEGADGDEAREISLEFSSGPAGATLTIRDHGKPFDPLAAPEHEQPADLEHAAIGGLGIHLIRRLMDECGYRREDGANVLHLSARAPADTAAPAGAAARRA